MLRKLVYLTFSYDENKVVRGGVRELIILLFLGVLSKRWKPSMYEFMMLYAPPSWTKATDSHRSLFLFSSSVIFF